MKAPDHYVEHVIEYFKQFVDREAIRENLRLTPEERISSLSARQTTKTVTALPLHLRENDARGMVTDA